MKNVNLTKICFLLVLALMLQIKIVNAQNLVPNPSFEDTIAGCPESDGQTYYCKDWIISINTPDYFTSCSNSIFGSQQGVPLNWAGNQDAATGLNYIGLYNYFSNFYWDGSDVREYIGCSLISPLVIGNTYYISMQVSKAEQFNCEASGLGVKLTTNIFWTVDSNYICPINNFYYSGFPNPINNIGTHCVISVDTIISNSTIWTSINGSFTADSAYQYLLIGNFLPRDDIDSIMFSGSLCASYYFIDNICLSEDSLTCNLPTETTNSIKSYKIQIYPNPVEKYFNIELQEYTNNEEMKIELYNTSGKLVLDKPLISINTLINTEHLKPGVYFLKIYNGNNLFVRKLFIN
jgi:hypothetical protein